MHVLGIKENQLEIRTVKSQAEKIPFSAYPLQLSTDFFFFFSLFSLRLPGLIVRLTPLYFSSCVSSFLSAGCGSSQASTSCLWNPATSLRGRSNRKWHREAVRWRWCVRGRPPPQQKGTTEAQISSFFFFFLFSALSDCFLLHLAASLLVSVVQRLWVNLKMSEKLFDSSASWL